ncbi:survival motor neuron protein isoform X1 [Schistocerca nitens]|uniref:survival motor neuron protein isoform X1 n=1 Tax=Schistocerca nitens TaxID=7011 RepID=UPI002118C9ED|nr:survival motor neuron protein isoform X1 [Schistocerca nitens]
MWPENNTASFPPLAAMKGSDTEESSSATHNSWDDKALVDAYEAGSLVAKYRIAARMIARGEQPLENGLDLPEQLESGVGQTVASKKSKKGNKRKWEVGAPCRAIFSEDGCEYEAIIQSVDQKKGKCVVKYIGYDNEEVVPVAALQPSQGSIARQYQIQQALENVESDNITGSDEDGEYHIDPFEDASSNGASWIGQSEFYNSRQGPFLNPQNPMSVPIPPPPPPHITSRFPEEDSEALSAMLLSWYMSGFHTGYYQGLRDAKKGRHKLSHPRMHSRKK